MRKLTKIWLVICLNALCVGTCVSYAVVSFPALFERFNDIVYDFWLVHYETKAPDRGPIIIDIDEKSTGKVGQLPWPRSILADLVNGLTHSGVAGIGLDIWFSEPDRSSPIAVDSLLEKNFGLNLDFSRLPPIALDNDRYFRNAVSGKPIALGGYASFAGEAKMPDFMPDPIRIEMADNRSLAEALKYVPVATGFIPPIPVIATAAPVGFLNVSFQADGVVRKMPLLVKAGEAVYPGLSLLTLLKARGLDTIRLESAGDGLEAIIIGETRIPVEKDGAFRPIYRGPARTLSYLSAVDILDGKAGRKELEGRVLFVGPSAQALRNLRSTPYGSDEPGAEIHATIVDNILAGESIRVPRNEQAILLALVFAIAFVGAVSFRLLPVYGYGLVSLGALSFLIGGSWLLFQHGLFLSPNAPVCALVLSALVTLPLRFWREQTERGKLKQAFNHYVAPEVVSRIITEGNHLLQGESKDITIMFTDVRGFTEISERLAPDQLVKLLNCYFTPMTACITAHHGTMDKFIGDALMAFWNAPLDVSNHAQEAVLAAIDMQAALARIQPTLLHEFGVQMRMGIGIHTGQTHVGNMGSEDLLDYTCIGENVNIASRLESMCKRYGMEIIVSGAVKEACNGSLDFLLMDWIKVKGSAKPIRIYVPLTRELPAALARMWRDALANYFNGSFAQAKKEFASIAEDDFLEKASQLFYERCCKLEREHPANWDGIWVYHEK